MTIKFILYLFTSSLWFSVLAVGEEISSHQAPEIGSIAMQPPIAPGNTSLDKYNGTAHKRQHEEYKLGYKGSRHQTYHRENQSYSKAARCESCHYFSGTLPNKSPMQAGRERIEGLFGTEKEGPRQFSTSETLRVNTDCLVCHSHNARHLHYPK